MSDTREFDLLTDIAKLLKKYGPETFESLASLVNSPETTRSLAEVLQATARISREASTPDANSGAGNAVRAIRQELDAIKDSEPGKHAILLDFHEALREKRALPTLKDMRAFAADRGLPGIEANTRQRAIAPLMRSLLDAPAGGLESIMSLVDISADEPASGAASAPATPRHDNALQGWSEIILGKDRAARTGRGQD